MKKKAVLIVALIVAIPVVGNAGSATSRWDMTLGGHVKFDAVWADKAIGVDNRTSPIDSKNGVDQATASTSNLTWGDAETRLNWAIKGPDAWGGKTSAFIEGDFRGRTGGTEYGLFGLRHAYFQIIWPRTKILIGHTWQPWGMIPSLSIMAVSEQHFNKGQRQPQITLTQTLTENFTGVFALLAPYFVEDFTTSNGNVGNDPWANGLWPDVVLDFSYKSNACGKIGPFGLKIGIGGFYGQDKYLLNRSDSASSPNYSDEKLERYGSSLYWYVPLVPEKKGNKTGAFGFTGELYAGKGMNRYAPAYSPGTTSGAYIRNVVAGSSVPLTTLGITNNVVNIAGSANLDLAYYMTQGGWVQGTFYFTDKLFMNAVYGFQYNNIPASVKTGNTTGTTGGLVVTRQNIPERIQNLSVNLMYDVNPAIRLGLEYDYVSAAYAYRETATLANKGNFNSMRFGAYYFF